MAEEFAGRDSRSAARVLPLLGAANTRDLVVLRGYRERLLQEVREVDDEIRVVLARRAAVPAGR